MDRIRLWFNEKVFLRSAWRKLFALFGLVILVTSLTLLVAGLTYGFRWKILWEMLATQVGAFDLDLEKPKFWGRFMFHLFCVLAFGGLLVSVFCSAIERHEERVQAGLVRYRNLKGHYVIVGWTAFTPVLVERLLRGDMDDWSPNHEKRPKGQKPRLLLCTVSDVGKVRRELEERLGAEEFRRVVFYYGGIEFDEPGHSQCGNVGRNESTRITRILDEFGIVFARQVFLLSDPADPWGRDIKVLAIARAIADTLRHVTENERSSYGLSPTLPVFAELDARGSQDIVQKFPESPIGRCGDNCRVYFRPFSVHELWAARLFSPDLPKGIRPLIYRPLKPGDRIHLVIVGFTRMGAALTAQALRSCHIPQQRQGDSAELVRTQITVIDHLPQENVFLARYPYIKQIGDVDLEFLVADVEDAKVRHLIRESAKDRHCLLTVAVCLEDSDSSLAIALNLPEEVYLWNKPTIKDEKGNIYPAPQHRKGWKEYGNNVWVRQDHTSGFADALGNDDTRFAWVGTFGAVSDVLTRRSFIEYGAMIRGKIYRMCKKNSNLKIADIHGKLLSGQGGTESLKDSLGDYLKNYLEMGWTLRWANVHAADAVTIFLSSLGYRAVPDKDDLSGFRERLIKNVKLFPVQWEDFESATCKAGFVKDAFAEAEHRRWMADRTLAGLRQAQSDEERDNEFLIHTCFRPFKDLTTQNNDRNSVLTIPICLALEGYRIEPA